MELTVLGKYGPYPAENDGACSGYLVENKGSLLVLDMGSGSLGKLISRVDIRDVTDIFISHHHYDHTSDLLPLRYMLEVSGNVVNIYTKHSDSVWYKILFTHPNFNVINVDEGSAVKVGSMELSFVKANHIDSSLAVIIKGEKTLCYTGDTDYFEGISACFERSDYVLADCCKPSGDKAKHMTVDDAKRLAEKYPDKTIIATHQPPEFNPVNEFASFGNIIIAKQNKTYRL